MIDMNPQPIGATHDHFEVGPFGMIHFMGIGYNIEGRFPMNGPAEPVLVVHSDGSWSFQFEGDHPLDETHPNYVQSISIPGLMIALQEHLERSAALHKD